MENSCLDRVFLPTVVLKPMKELLNWLAKYAKIHLGENRHEIITMSKSFHGRTHLDGYRPRKYHQGYSPLPQGFNMLLSTTWDLRKSLGPHTCAIMLEPIQERVGLSRWEDYLQRVRQLCDEKGLLLIFDEVQCGMGRTGTLFAYENYGVEPDIMTLAKALRAGCLLGLFWPRNKWRLLFQPGDHAPLWRQPLVTTAAIAVLETIFTENSGQCPGNGRLFGQGLENLRQKYSCIKEIRGKGLMIGAELDCPAGPVVTGCRERGL